MTGEVAVHVALLVEAPAAERTEEGLLPRVGEQVALDPTRVTEDLGAQVLFLDLQMKRPNPRLKRYISA